MTKIEKDLLYIQYDQHRTQTYVPLQNNEELMKELHINPTKMNTNLDRLHENHFNGRQVARGCGWTTYVCNCIMGYLFVLENEYIPVVVTDEQHMNMFFRSLLPLLNQNELGFHFARGRIFFKNNNNVIYFLFSGGHEERPPYTWNEKLYMKLANSRNIQPLYDDFVELSSKLPCNDEGDVLSLENYRKRVKDLF